MENQTQRIPEVILEDTPIQNRKQILKDNCYCSYNSTYNKKFTDQELLDLKEELANQSIALSEIEAEFAKVKLAFNEKSKPLQQKIESVIQNIKFGVSVLTGEVYEMDYQEEGVMGIYDANGELIKVRELKPTEKRNVLRIEKTGTNE